MYNKSPLRYPGGKSAIYQIIKNAIITNGLEGCCYVEPFAGGAGIAINLLLDGVVSSIIINDADKAIYSFWRAVIEYPDWFIQKIETTQITIEEWKRQKEIVEKGKSFSKELGFAAFYLNRTNRSGILSAGPIGGFNQNGEYKIDCRFNKKKLIEKIKNIVKKKRNIKIYNKDAIVFTKKYLSPLSKKMNIFVYFDPPYFEKGQRLYLNHFNVKDHIYFKQTIECVEFDWILSYDNQEEIKELYDVFPMREFSINYSLSNKTKGKELMIFKNISYIPSKETVDMLPKTVDFLL